MCMPLFDGGNLGFRRRQMQKIFQLDGYVPFSNFFEGLKDDGDKVVMPQGSDGVNGSQNGH